jgi:hypothetical protein
VRYAIGKELGNEWPGCVEVVGPAGERQAVTTTTLESDTAWRHALKPPVPDGPQRLAHSSDERATALFHLLALAAQAERSRSLQPEASAVRVLETTVGASLKHLRNDFIPKLLTTGLVKSVADAYATFVRTGSMTDDDLREALRVALQAHHLHLPPSSLDRMLATRAEITKRGPGSDGGPVGRARQRLAVVLFDRADGRKVREIVRGSKDRARTRGFGAVVTDDAVLRYVLRSLFGWSSSEVNALLSRPHEREGNR